MTFSITPVTGFPTPTGTEPKRNIQFQWGGVDIGERNTDTVNITIAIGDTMQGTIGVGERANVLTLALDPTPPAPPQPLWLDLFDGVADTQLQDHPQNLPINGSVWLQGDSNSWRLDGLGSAVPDGIIYSYNYTQLANGDYLQLAGEWIWEVEFSITDNPPDSFRFELNGDNALTFRIADGNARASIGFYEVFLTMPPADQVNLFRVVVRPDSVVVYLNGVAVIDEPSIPGWAQVDSVSLDGASAFGGGTATVYRMELFGTLA